MRPVALLALLAVAAGAWPARHPSSSYTSAAATTITTHKTPPPPPSSHKEQHSQHQQQQQQQPYRRPFLYNYRYQRSNAAATGPQHPPTRVQAAHPKKPCGHTGSGGSGGGSGSSRNRRPHHIRARRTPK